MRSLFTIGFLAAFLLDTTAAALSTKSLVTCVTSYGTKSTSPVKTNSKVLTVSLTATQATVVTPKETITPTSTVTSTVTAIVTSSTTLTPPQSISTLTITETNSFTGTDGMIIVVLTTTTSVTTITLTGEATTIQPSAGFVPIETGIPISQKKHRAIAGKPIDARAEPDLVARAAALKYKITFNKGKKTTCSPAVYPAAVGCAGLVAVVTTKTITKTASRTQTVVAPQPTTVLTTTSTVVVTLTITPDAASSIVTTTAATTETVTATISTTSTIGETTTISETVPGATVYAACANNNIATVFNGQFLQYIDILGNFMTYDTDSAYDCCVQCAKTPNCAGTAGRESTRECYLAIADTCGPTNAAIGLHVTKGENSNAFASNGNCGVISST